MTGRLHVRFANQQVVQSAREEVRLPVTLTQQRGTQRPDRRDEMVPINQGKLVENLPSGLWLLKARLPSGELLNTSVEVSSESTIDAVLDLAGFGDREPEADFSPITHAFELARPTRSSRTRLQPGSHTLYPTLRLCVGRLPDLQSGRVLTPRFKTRNDGSMVIEATLPCDPRSPWWLILVADQQSIAWRVPPAAHGTETRVRVRSLIENEEEIEDIAAMGRKVGWEATFDFGNDQAAMLLGYLESSSSAVVRRVGTDFLETAIDLLEEKGRDLTSAIVAGYFLQQAVDWSEGADVGRISSERLARWLRNLADMSGPQSDGSIIFGHWLLDAGRASEARAVLLSGFAQGVPIFSFGLRALSRGFGVIYAASQQTDEEIGRALEELSGIFLTQREPSTALSLDLSIPFAAFSSAPTTDKQR